MSSAESRYESKFDSKNFRLIFEVFLELKFNYFKHVDGFYFDRIYLEELKKTCKNEEIFIERTTKMKYHIVTAANLEAYIMWSNRLSNFVTCEIVKNLKRDQRVKLIQFFIDVASSCFELGNFNSTMSIIGIRRCLSYNIINFFLNLFFYPFKASLKSSYVSRLRKTVKYYN